MDERTHKLAEECRRQEESCLYTSTALFEWLKFLRVVKVVFVAAPIVLAGVATFPLLKKQTDLEWLTGICALLAGVFPAVYKALDLDVSLDVVAKQAHDFKVLQDRFRTAARVTALGPFDAFDAEFKNLMDRMDDARAASLTAPERFFAKAQKKIAAGHYSFTVDSPPQPTT
jgi:hypothetical protein